MIIFNKINKDFSEKNTLWLVPLITYCLVDQLKGVELEGYATCALQKNYAYRGSVVKLEEKWEDGSELDLTGIREEGTY